MSLVHSIHHVLNSKKLFMIQLISIQCMISVYLNTLAQIVLFKQKWSQGEDIVIPKFSISKPLKYRTLSGFLTLQASSRFDIMARSYAIFHLIVNQLPVAMTHMTFLIKRYESLWVVVVKIERTFSFRPVTTTPLYDS